MQVLRFQRHVGGAERDGLRLDLLDAAARTDRLIIEAVAGLLPIGIRPFRVDRIREGGTRPRDVGGVGRGEGDTRCGSNERRADDGLELHFGLSRLKGFATPGAGTGPASTSAAN